MLGWNIGMGARGRRGECPFLLGLLVSVRDRVVIVHVAVLGQVLVERLRNGFPDDQLAGWGLDRLAGEERDAGFAWPRGVDATPWRQQVALIIGVVFGSIVIPPVLQVMLQAFGFDGMESADPDTLTTSK